METPIKNDPFAMIYQAFTRLYPDKQCEVWFGAPNDEDIDVGSCGITNFPNDGGLPQVFIYPELPIVTQAETFAHELAHVAVGVEHGHDEVWDRAFESIHVEYEKLALELFGNTGV